MALIEQGCIDIWIDEIVPCLRDVETGDIRETVVFKIESRAYLKKFQKKNGWHINWNEIPKEQFFMDEQQAKKLLEVYHYEWNEA